MEAFLHTLIAGLEEMPQDKQLTLLVDYVLATEPGEIVLALKQNTQAVAAHHGKAWPGNSLVSGQYGTASIERASAIGGR